MAGESQILEVTAGDAAGQKPTAKVLLVNSSGVSLHQADGMVVVGDTRFYVGAGAPVDYTDGTPPATGEAEAGIGSVYIDTTNGKLYVNGGTKAQPTWKLVTSAA